MTLAVKRISLQFFCIYLFLRRLTCLQNNFLLWTGEISKFWLTAPFLQALVQFSPPGLLFTGVARNTLSLPLLWLSVALSVVLCILPAVGYQFLKPLFCPSTVNKVSGIGNLPSYNSIHDPLCLASVDKNPVPMLWL